MNIKCTIWWKSVHSLLLYHLSISVIVVVYRPLPFPSLSPSGFFQTLKCVWHLQCLHIQSSCLPWNWKYYFLNPVGLSLPLGGFLVNIRTEKLSCLGGFSLFVHFLLCKLMSNWFSPWTCSTSIQLQSQNVLWNSCPFTTPFLKQPLRNHNTISSLHM